MLTLVENHPENRRNRLGLATAHLESAIAHINNEAQGRLAAAAEQTSTEELRTIVRALCDIVDVLQADVLASTAARRIA